MLKLTIALTIIILLTGVCKNAIKSNRDQIALINKALTAISKYDTLALYDMIDTNRCFRIYGKDGFLFKIDYAYKRIKVCGFSIDERNVIVKPAPINRKEYIITLCRNTNENELKVSFDLIFMFDDNTNENLIDYFDIEPALVRKKTDPLK